MKGSLLVCEVRHIKKMSKFNLWSNLKIELTKNLLIKIGMLHYQYFMHSIRN